MPTVSIIIPNYNHAPYVEQRIDSVLAQTYQDFEVIILDDKSPDNSIEIIEKYRNHPKISHIIYNEVNSGSTFKQWEKGIHLAKGDWIWIAESDDWCSTLFLEIMMPDILAESNVSIGFCQSYTLMPQNNTLVRHQIEPKKKLIDSEEFFNHYLVKGNSIYNASMVIFNKRLYHEIASKEYTNYRYCGDWIFWAELSKKGNVLRFSELLNYFRKTGEIDVTHKAVGSGLNYLEDIKALHYFRTKLNCDNIIYLRTMKRYYFKFQSNSEFLTDETKALIKQNFKKYLGYKRVLFWDLKYKKHMFALKIFNLFKEHV